MAPYNPNSIWTSKNSPNLPKIPQSSLRQQPEESQPQLQSLPSFMPPPQEPERKPSHLRRYGLIAAGTFMVLLLIGAGVFAYVFRAPAAPASSVTIAPVNGALVGSPFSLSISSANHSGVSLSGAILAVQLPDGISFVGDDPQERTKEYPLNDIAPGAVVTQSSTLIITGNPNTLFPIAAKLVYSTAQTPQATYESDAAASISGGASVVTLSYAAPGSIVSGQSFPIAVHYANNGAQPIPDAQISMAYPPAFSFGTSSIPAVDGTNNGTWDIGALAPGQGGSFTITGAIVGPVQAQYQLMGTMYAVIGGQRYAMNAQPANFTMVASPLALAITLNGTSSYVAAAGDNLSYTLAYANNSNATFSSVKITAALVGQMYDLASLHTNGAFNSKAGTITWYAANTPALASLAPGQSGTVTFTVRAKAAFPIRLPSDKNYLLKVTGTIQSPTVLANVAGSSTVSVVTAQNKMAGAVALAAKGYWKTGPYPPKVDQPTTYAIDWVITNYATDAQNVTISGYLQSGTSFVGSATSNISTTPSYDPGTGLVTWTIPFIPAGTGIVTPAVQGEFLVSNTPAVNQVGFDVTLLGKTALAATDAFTGNALSSGGDPVTTALPYDTSLGHINRSVVK